MSRNNTGNPIGSKAFPDFEDNVPNFDLAMNSKDPTWVDRLGELRPTYQGAVDPTGLVQQAVGAADRAEVAAATIAAMGDGKYYFQTEAQLLASSPAENAAAKALDTKKVWFWDVAEQIWMDTGLSELDQAKAYANNVPYAKLGARKVEVSGSGYIVASIRGGGSDHIPGEFITGTATAVSMVFEVVSGNTYTIAKEPSDRFRVAEFSAMPVNGDEALRYPKDDRVEGVAVDGGEYFTFVPGSDTTHVVVYLSISSQKPMVMMTEGGFQGLLGTVELSSKTVFVEDAVFQKDVSSRNIVTGKNLFDPSLRLPAGMVVAGSISIPEGILRVSSTSPDAVSFYAPVEPSTTYTISKAASDRFRLALSTGLPVSGASVYIIASDESDNKDAITFTTRADSQYLVAYLSTTATPPSFVQLEAGGVRTEWETFGYEFFPKVAPLAQAVSGLAVGDANYISKLVGSEGAWADDLYTIPATDDTAALQALFDAADGVVSLDHGKKFRITGTIYADIRKAKSIMGNMSTILVDGDFDAIRWTGTLTGTANAGSLNAEVAYNEMSPIMTALRITSVMGNAGTGAVLQGCMAPILFGCSFKYLRRGVAFKGINRNVIINACNIYACEDYGIHFEPGGDLHQVIISNNHISYCRKNIFGENQSLFNINIVGNDIETSSYPDIADCNIHFQQTTAPLEDLKIVGNTIEDHLNTSALVILDGGTGINISSVCLSGNVIGNSAGAALQIGGIRHIDISGLFKYNSTYTVDIVGDVHGMNLNARAGQGGAGLLRAVGEFIITGLNTTGSGCTGGGIVRQPILIDVDEIRNCNISNMTLGIDSLAVDPNTSERPPAVSIRAGTMSLVRVDSNNIDSKVGLVKAIEVVCTGTEQPEKGSMRGNMSTSGTFHAPTAFMIGDNL